MELSAYFAVNSLPHYGVEGLFAVLILKNMFHPKENVSGTQPVQVLLSPKQTLP